MLPINEIKKSIGGTEIKKMSEDEIARNLKQVLMIKLAISANNKSKTKNKENCMLKFIIYCHV